MCLGLITALGFGLHQEIEAVASIRFLATYLPVLVVWMVTAGGLGALDPIRAADPRQWWRPGLAVLVTAPIAAVLRSAWLGTPPVTVFVAVMAGMTMIGLGSWRIVYWRLGRASPT